MIRDTQQTLLNEARIVWLVPLAELPRYVRESVVSSDEWMVPVAMLGAIDRRVSEQD